MTSLWQNVRSSRLVVVFSLAFTILLSSNISAQEAAMEALYHRWEELGHKQEADDEVSSGLSVVLILENDIG